MKNKNNQASLPAHHYDREEMKGLPGYPSYPAGEDIFSRYKEETNISPEDTSKIKETNDNDKIEENGERDLTDAKLGSDLDVPGSELDDEQESIGNEDEENNYYSLGGDDHNDLDEDKGD